MSVTTTVTIAASTKETIDSGVTAVDAANATILHDKFNFQKSLTSTTTPPVTNASYFTQALSAGAATIDLTALTEAGGGTLDATGLKVQVLLLNTRGKSNAGAITITKGFTNGYSLAGSTTGKVTLAGGDGEAVCFFFNDSQQDVSATVKTLDLSGTGTDSIDIGIVVG